MKYAPPGDQEVFYAHMLKHCRDEAETACVMLLWRTGMHASTLCGRDWTFIGDYCHWQRTKTGKYLRAKVPAAEARVIFRCERAGLLPTSASTLQRWVRRIGDRAGYAALRVSPNTFRHSRAVYLRDRGLKREEVAQVIGCSVAVLDKHYGQLSADELVSRVEKAERLV